MKPFVATLLATALTAAFSSAYAHETTAVKTDTVTYKTMSNKAAADYKMAAAKCTGMTGNERAVCIEDAKVARARLELNAVTEHNNTLKARIKARTALANAEHALARVKCSVMTGADKTACQTSAHTLHTAALADAKADREIRVATANAVGVDGKGLIANTATTEPVKAAAVDKCAQVAGKPTTGCLVDNKNKVAVTTDAAVATNNAAVNTRNAAANAAQKTESLAERAVEKTKNAAAIVADKTERAVDRVTDGRVADRTAATADRVGDKAENAAARTGKVVADSVITTKVKADLFKEPALSAMAIHVETEKGVVMLSGFVDSKADAERAVRLAKSVEGVTQVKSAIKVK